MCGINGFNFKNELLIKKMNKIIEHRGPDGSGVFVDEHISLGHNRLSIIDLSDRANQPMASNDGNLVLVFNGEIYNYKELKKELADYPYQSDSDSEVILAAYKKWGKDCLAKLNGIFALAIWDKLNKELILARDIVGVKPLYYYFNNNKLIFSSEIKGILEHQIERKLNYTAFNLYLKMLYTPAPQTLIKNIYKLPPASYAIYKNGELEIKKYWQLKDYDNLSGGANKIKEIIREIFDKAVKRQLVADVPVGLYLSGGIDSTVILGAMKNAGLKDIKTFSVGFDVKEQYEKFNVDFKLARQTAKYYNTDHNEILLSAKDAQENLMTVLSQMDDPVANPTQLPLYFLSKLTSECGIKVVLGGDGGDELFGGYDRYYYYRQLECWSPWLKPIKNLLPSKYSDKLNWQSDLDIYLSFRSQKDKTIKRFVKNGYIDELAVKDYLIKYIFDNLPDCDLAKKMMKADLDSWLVDHSFNQTDKMSMAHGVEQRVPILDKEMIELSFKVATKYKLENAKQGKKIFRHAVVDYIPRHVANRPKAGFFTPMAKWLRTDMKAMTYEILSPSYNLATKELFDFDEIKKILDSHIDGSNYALNTLWSLIVFQVWFKDYKIEL